MDAHIDDSVSCSVFIIILNILYFQYFSEEKKAKQKTHVYMNRHTSLQEHGGKIKINNNNRTKIWLRLNFSVTGFAGHFISFHRKESFVFSVKTNEQLEDDIAKSCTPKRKMKAWSERIEKEYSIQTMTVLIKF